MLQTLAFRFRMLGYAKWTIKPTFPPPTMKSPDTILEEYRSLNKSFGRQVQNCWKIGTISTIKLIFLSIDPTYIVLQTRWNDKKDKKVVEYCEWESLQQDYVVNQDITDTLMPFGDLLSISPSRQFGLFAKPSNNKGEWDVSIIDFDRLERKTLFQLPSSAFNTPFSCFQWIQGETSIS